MKTRKILVSTALMICVAFGANAQTNTFYFMDGIPTRHEMNPAFMPNSAWYLGLPVISGWNVEAGNNSFTLNDIFKQNGSQWVTAFHKSQNIDNLYNSAKSLTNLGGNFGISLLNFGFRAKNVNYFTFDLSLKGDANAYMPKDFFKLLLYGTPDEKNDFNFSKLGVSAAVYGELGLGYIREINDKWNFGFKVKGLVGLSGIQTNINRFKLSASTTEWNIDAQGDFYAMSPAVKYNEADSTFSVPHIAENWKEYIKKPSGLGVAIDLGASYKPIENLTISAAVTDLGFISWNDRANIIHGNANGIFNYTGIEYIPGDDFKANFDSIVDALKASTSWEVHQGYNKHVMQMLTANANVGIEYGILDNKISFGAVSHTRINMNRINEEVTLAANLRPVDWFKTYFSYTFLDGMQSIGAGINLRIGAFNMFIVSDYVPLSYANINKSGKTAVVLPFKNPQINLQGGLILTFGRGKDTDKDGVKDKKDLCPDTDIKALIALCPDTKRKDFVDKSGCTKDEDGDGVPDCYDRCPNTPAGAPVDEFGCLLDTDGDGVPDYLDRCPDTPAGVVVDKNGCPLDEDGDGVPDYLDRCPNTPAGVAVDAEGCPFDEDSDGVPDYLDKCPNTPAGVAVDADGCPLDSDGDGVPDYLDKCPNTPKGINVDKDGCASDADGDGVPDEFDRCPNTPHGVEVDENGCPLDSDGDGVPDYLDRCPNTPGVASNYGCPEIKAEIKKVFKQALNGIQFETGKANIKKTSNAILNQIVTIMTNNPDFNLDIAGHTDNVGKPEMNLDLSKRRAAAVKDYLVKKGIDASRITTEGYGDTRPVDAEKYKSIKEANNTEAKRAKNRRVEFTVVFERMVVE